MLERLFPRLLALLARFIRALASVWILGRFHDWSLATHLRDS